MGKLSRLGDFSQLDNLAPDAVGKGISSVSFLVSGETALFADPISRGGGEKISYMVPTYSAMMGIAKSIFWKPTMEWRIDRVRVMKPIQMETKSMLYPRLYRQDKPGEADRSFCTYLRDVAYQVDAHIIWNEERPDLKGDRVTKKYLAMAHKAIDRGGRFPVYLGKKEGSCMAYVMPCEFGEGDGAYDHDGDRALGIMAHSITYPTRKDTHMYANFWGARMRNGIIEFPAPSECPKELVRMIKNCGLGGVSLGGPVVKPIDEELKEAGE